jgi:hypothetical protein
MDNRCPTARFCVFPESPGALIISVVCFVERAIEGHDLVLKWLPFPLAMHPEGDPTPTRVVALAGKHCVAAKILHGLPDVGDLLRAQNKIPGFSLAPSKRSSMFATF